MSNSVEVVITSEGSGQLWNACVWDPHAGTTLMTYKGGGVAAPHSLCLLGKDYLMLSDHTKPVLHAWQLNSQQSVLAQGVRLVCPGRVNSLVISPDGCYCVTAIAEKLHIWQIASGRHLVVAVRHFQSVTCVRFTDDGSHFVSGGEDGLVLVWPLAYLISGHGGEFISGQTEPRYVISDHALPVRDLYVGPGGIRAHLLSVSADRTCKLYDLASGSLLLSLVFDCGLSAVTLDATERQVFVGGVDGNIYQFGLHSPPRIRDYHLTKEEKAKMFSGHSKAVTCLSASIDGLTLLSSSLDATVKLWHIPSRQCIRILQHKGPVTNAFFSVAPKNIFSEEMKPTIILRSFQKSSDIGEEGLIISIRTTQDGWEIEDDNEYNMKHGQMGITSDNEESGLKDQIIALKKVNSDLYGFAVEKLLQPFSDIKMKNQKQKEITRIGLYKKSSQLVSSESVKKQNSANLTFSVSTEEHNSFYVPSSDNEEKQDSSLLIDPLPKKKKYSPKVTSSDNEENQNSFLLIDPVPKKKYSPKVTSSGRPNEEKQDSSLLIDPLPKKKKYSPKVTSSDNEEKQDSFLLTVPLPKKKKYSPKVTSSDNEEKQDSSLLIDPLPKKKKYSPKVTSSDNEEKQDSFLLTDPVPQKKYSPKVTSSGNEEKQDSSVLIDPLPKKKKYSPEVASSDIAENLDIPQKSTSGHVKKKHSTQLTRSDLKKSQISVPLMPSNHLKKHKVSHHKLSKPEKKKKKKKFKGKMSV